MHFALFCILKLTIILDLKVFELDHVLIVDALFSLKLLLQVSSIFSALKFLLILFILMGQNVLKLVKTIIVKGFS